MKSQIFVLLTILLLFVESKVFAEMPFENEDPIAQAVFAGDLRGEKSENKDQNGIGVVMQGARGWGLVYSRNTSPNRFAWLEGTYASDTDVFLEPYGPSTQVAKVDIFEKSRMQIIAGLDQVVHLNRNNYWGFILGLGVGLNRSEYQSKYYRELCTFFCGYDRRSPVEKNEIDLFGFISARLGIAFLDTQVWGLKGDMKIILMPVLARSGSFAFTGPDGRKFSATKFVSYVIEGSVEF